MLIFYRVGLSCRYGRPTALRPGHRAPGSAVRRPRPRGPARQRRRPGPPGRGQADPGRQQVGPLPGRCSNESSPWTGFTGSWPSPCPRRSGWSPTGVRRRAGRLPHRRPRRARRAGRRPERGRRESRSWSTASSTSTSSSSVAAVRSRDRHELRLCLDLDASLRRLRRPVHGSGVRRSPVRAADQAADARRRRSPTRPGFRLVGPDGVRGADRRRRRRPAGQPRCSRGPIRLMQAQSRRELARRRGRDRPGRPPDHRPGVRQRRRHRQRREDRREDAVTEVAAGLGPLPARACSTSTALLRPPRPPCSPCPSSAARRRTWSPCSAAAASPPAPADRSRLPQPYLPAGLRFDPEEGAGEVQTPLLGQRRRPPARSATACGSVTPRPASSANASPACT